MPLTPESAPQPPEEVIPREFPGRPRPWQSRLLGICFAIFTFEVGLFLVVFPWTDTWNLNYLQELIHIQGLWPNSYFRGALTGLGLVNVYLACLEVARLVRRA